LRSKLQVIKKTAERYLKTITEIFPEYTPHEISHKYTVIENLSKLIPLPLASIMNKYEIFFLLSAAYVHDVGMSKLNELGDGEELTDLVKDTIRKTHHIRIKDLLYQHPNLFDLKEQEARYIAKIAMGHRKVDLSNQKEFRHYDVFDSEKINIPLLAAFLRLADELDITYMRIPPFLYKHSPPKNPISLAEWKKHWSTTGVNFDDDRVIKASSFSENSEIERKLNITKREIQTQLDELPKYLYQYLEFKDNLYYRFQLTIERIGYADPEVKLEFDPKTIMKLLMGEKIYKNRTYAIRELLKNAIDTCRRKSALSERGGFPYLPLISVFLASNRLIIRDNGMGMDLEFIKSHFTKVGQSYYKSREFKEQDLQFTPLGELGIGILSCFMIADKIEITAKTDSSKPVYVELEDISDFLYIKELEEQIQTGTTIELSLKDDLINESNIADIVERYVRHLEFPIEVNGRSIKDKGYNPTVNYLRPFSKNIFFRLYHIKIRDESAIGTISLVGKNTKKKKFLPLERYKYDNINVMYRNKFYLSNNGVLIQDEIDSSFKSIIPPWLNRQLICGEINFLKHSLTLNISRDVIIYDEESIRLSNIIGQQIVKAFSKLLEDRYWNRLKINSFLESHIFITDYHMKSSKRNQIKDDFISLPRDNSDLTNLVKAHYSFLCLSNGKLDYLKYLELEKSHNNTSILDIQDLLTSRKLSGNSIVKVLKNLRKFEKNAVYILNSDPLLGPILDLLFPNMRSAKIMSKDITKKSKAR
jgi:hypothetical protein